VFDITYVPGNGGRILQFSIGTLLSHDLWSKKRTAFQHGEPFNSICIIIFQIVQPDSEMVGQDDAPEVWYKEGLRFECRQCGMCCSVSGMVWVTRSEIWRISRYLGMSEEVFTKAYVKELGSQLTLGERADGGCLLLDPGTKSCKVYTVRPQQCSSFPFWPELLKNQVTWARESTLCPGMNKGRIWELREIKKKMLKE
jgi:uncharacterized protein